MPQLPRKIGPLTLTELAPSHGRGSWYQGSLDDAETNKTIDLWVRSVGPIKKQETNERKWMHQRIEVLASLASPHLDPILAAADDKGAMLVAYPHTKDPTLESLLNWCAENQTSIPPNILLDLGIQLSNALESLHGHRIDREFLTHLNLRPSSILISAEGKIRLTNYGFTSPGHPRELRESGNDIRFLSPELYQNSVVPSPASDLFSLGLILYEMQTLQPLVSKESLETAQDQIAHMDLSGHCEAASKALPGLDQVLIRALSKSPKQRYQRAFVLREGLRELMPGYSFSKIRRAVTQFLEPFFETMNAQAPGTLFIRNAPPKQSPSQPEADHTPVEAPLSFDASIELSDDTDWSEETELVTETSPKESSKQSKPEENAENIELELELDPIPEAKSSDAGEEEDTFEWQRKPLLSTKMVGLAGMSAMGILTLCVVGYGLTRLANKESIAPEIALVQDLPEEDPVGLEENPEAATEAAPAKEDEVAPPPTEQGVEEVLIEEEAPTPKAAPPEKKNTRATTKAAPPKEPSPSTSPKPASTSSSQTRSSAPTPPVAKASPPPKEKPAPPPVVKSTPEPTPQPPVVKSTPEPTPQPPPTSSDAVAEAEIPTQVMGEDEELNDAILQQFSNQAQQGALSSNTIRALREVALASPFFTRAHAILYTDSKRRGDVGNRRVYLNALMKLESNHYRPEFLVELAELALSAKDYATALTHANLAEQHWGRLPPALVFTRRAMIYEIQASAHTGLFWNSHGEDLDSLHLAIRTWTRYREHVERGEKPQLIAKADQKISALYSAKQRLE